VVALADKGATAPASAAPARTTPWDTWEVIGNGFAGALIFSAFLDSQGDCLLPGDCYIGTAYQHPMLEMFVLGGVLILVSVVALLVGVYLLGGGSTLRSGNEVAL
jgi:hypothetical protein